MSELSNCIPNAEMRWRKGTKIKQIIPEAIERGYTYLIIVEEHRKIPSYV